MSAAANPVRPALGIVALPPREPDAVERSPEHIRRAREVFGSVARLVGHGGNMPSARPAVAPNNIILFGGSQ